MARTKKLKNCPTLESFILNNYLLHARLRKRSWRMDERIARVNISPLIGSLILQKIRRADVEKWINDLLRAGYSPASCNRFLSTLKAIFSFAEMFGAISIGLSPTRGVGYLKTAETRERFLTGDEAHRLMECLCLNRDKRALAIQLILLTGARKNEICRARWEYVDLERQMLKIPLSKSGKTRFIPLSRQAIKILRKIQKIPDCPWIFPGATPNKPMADPYRFWNQIRQEASIPDVRIHDLRHSFASFLVNGGHTLYEVQKLLGHANPGTTMRYAHLAWDSLLQAADDVGETLII